MNRKYFKFTIMCGLISQILLPKETQIAIPKQMSKSHTILTITWQFLKSPQAINHIIRIVKFENTH